MKVSRDNARVSMHWNASTYAGFSTVKPWLGLAQNHTTVNVANDLANPQHSIYYYYKSILALRKISIHTSTPWQPFMLMIRS